MLTIKIRLLYHKDRPRQLYENSASVYPQNNSHTIGKNPRRDEMLTKQKS